MAYTHDTRDLTPVMTANNAPSPIVVSASSEFSATYLAYYAFNHIETSNCWLSSTAPSVGNPQWLKIDFGIGNEQYVGSYAMNLYASLADACPTAWTFEGSSNGTDWVILDNRSGEVAANWSGVTLRYFNCQKSGLFRYYRVNITAGGSVSYVNIAELELFDTRVNLCQTMTSNTAPAPYSAFADTEYSAGYEAFKSVDKSITTKWASTNSAFPHWLAIYFGGDKYIFSGISITGADYPSSATAKASPSTFKIQGSNDNVTYDDLASYSGVTSWTENINKYFSCKSSKAYRFIRIYITANDGSSDNIVNIRELKVFGQLKDKCITPVMTANNAPSPYVVTFNAEYQTGTGYRGYRSFDRVRFSDYSWLSSYPSVTTPSWIQIYFGGNLCKVSYLDINGYLSYGNPRDFTIQGSIDAITYTVMGTFTSQTWESGEYRTFPVTEGYWKYIKINITSFNVATGSGCGEILIYGEQFSNLCATMTSNSLPAPYSCSASQEQSATYAAWKAFNKDNSQLSGWYTSNGTTSGWLQYYFGGIYYIINAVILADGSYDTGMNPKDFTIEVSNDGSNWVIVRTVTNQTGWQGAERRLFTFKTYSGYKYLRINATTNNSSGLLGINELEIYGRPAKQIINGYPDVTPPMTAASVPENWAVTATDNWAGSDPFEAFDHVEGTWDSNSWYAASGVLPKYNQIKLSSPIAFNRIDMKSPTTRSDNMPQDFEIYGSIDGSLYTLLAFVQGIIWGTSTEGKTFRFENNISYNYCKINCLTIKPSLIGTYYVTLGEVYISREEREDCL